MSRYEKYMRYINKGVKVGIVKIQTGYNSTYNPEYRVIDVVFKVEGKLYWVRHNQVKYSKSVTAKSVFCNAKKDHYHYDEYWPLDELSTFNCGLPFNIDAVKDQIKKFVRWKLFNGESCINIIV